MKRLLHEIAIPFQGSKEAVQLLLAGSRVMTIYLLRCLAKGIKFGWAAAMQLDAAPPQDVPADNGTNSKRTDVRGAGGGKGKPGSHRSKRPGGASADGRFSAFMVALLVVFIALGVAVTGIALVWHFAAPYVANYAQWIAVILMAVWTVTAWIVAPPVSAPEPDDDHEDSSGDQHDEDPEEQFDLALASFIVSAVVDADREGHKGVHLTELLQRLKTEKQGFEAWDTTRLRAWCTTTAIPFDRGVRAKGKGPTWGVRADQLEQALEVPLREALATLPQHLARARAAGDSATPAPGAHSAPAEPVSPAEQPPPIMLHS
ncbi:hypothetical protein [Streptomyces sp. NPDC020667]|uniref:hypothetical protein n=1 Tax=Streptomyces sp. NPDC020667 TaxID=3154895 RepID=UPI0033F6505F